MMKKNKEILISILITITSIIAYLYAFIIANRNNIFLYEHLGSTPFDQTTTGRYWMFGFVVAGFICVAFFIILTILSILKKRIKIDWISVAKYITIPLLISVIIIVTEFGEPRLTYSIAISTSFTLIFALLIGLSFINDLTTKWLTTVKHLIIGLGIIPFAIFFRALELPDKGILSMNSAILISTLTFVFGIVWVIIAKWIFRNQEISTMLILKAIIVITCIGLPVLHHLMTIVEGHPYYITSSDNIFADNIFLRLANWALIIIVISGINRIKLKKKPVANNL